MQNYYAVILAGGQGTRLNIHTRPESELPKQFKMLNGKPLIIHTLEKFYLPVITGIIIVVPGEYIEHTDKLVKEYQIKKIIKIIKGGETRQGSSYNALKCLDYNDTDILIFHDAARPFVRKEIVLKCAEEAKIYGAAGIYVKTTDTIAEAESDFIKAIPMRKNLYNTQTPQAFKYSIIKKAHELSLSKGDGSTDDVQLVINAGNKVKICEGDYRNIKITTAADFEFAEFILKKENV